MARGTSPLGLRTSYSRWNRSRGGAALESPVVDRGLGSDSGMGARRDSSVHRPPHFLKAIPATSGKVWLVEQVRWPPYSVLEVASKVVAGQPQRRRVEIGDWAVIPGLVAGWTP